MREKSPKALNRVCDVVWVVGGCTLDARSEPEKVEKDLKAEAEEAFQKKLPNMGEEVAQAKASAGSDETDRATAPADDECCAGKSPLIEKSEVANCDGSVSQPQAEKSPKKAKPQDSSFEKSKKWYNISFMHRSSQHRRENTADKNSSKLDNRHSWHLNESVEMWVNTFLSPCAMFRGLLHVFVSDFPHRVVFTVWWSEKRHTNADFPVLGDINSGALRWFFFRLELLIERNFLSSAIGARRTQWIIHDNKSALRKIDSPWKFHQRRRPARGNRVPMPIVSRYSDRKEPQPLNPLRCFETGGWWVLRRQSRCIE